MSQEEVDRMQERLIRCDAAKRKAERERDAFSNQVQTLINERDQARAGMIRQMQLNVKVVKERIAAVDSRDAIIEAMQDFAKHGIRFDLTPTIDGRSDVYVQMTRYIQRIDKAVRERAAHALVVRVAVSDEAQR